MDLRTAKILNGETRAFYDAQAESFSATRQTGWPGWERVVGCLKGNCQLDDACAGERPLRVLDVACGNRRFQRYLAEMLPGADLAYCGVDSCAALAPGAQECDIVSALLAGEFSLDAGYSLVACFGFMHHVPGAKTRLQLAQELCTAAQPGGLVAISFWRFMENPSLAERAEESCQRALADPRFANLALDANDYLLGWQQDTEHFRYCHHFPQDEVDNLAGALVNEGRAQVVDRFCSDGRTGNLNAYLVLRAC